MGALSQKTGKAAREEREKMLILKHKYENRITIAKFGKEALDVGDYGSALKRFMEYLSILGEVKGVRDIYSIKIQHFDSKREITELLMISHIYFEMSRMYDAVPKFADDSRKCLEQFVHFSVNQPYQVINSEMIRKYLKKSNFKNPETFRHAYHQIYVQSKKCYVVTFCLGDEHRVTNEYRELKDVMLRYRTGQELVRIYYNYSSLAVTHWSNSPSAKFVGRYIATPLLLLFSKTILRLILR